MEFICIADCPSAKKGDVAVLKGDWLEIGGHKVCYATSQDSHDFFALNDDGKGEERYELTHGIMAKVAELNRDYERACAEALEALGDDREPSEEAVQEALSGLENKASLALDKAAKAGYLTNVCWNHSFFVETIRKLKSLKNAIDAL